MSARRRRSAKPSACAASRASRSASAVWSALLPTGTTHTHRRPPKPRRRTAIRWRSSVPALPALPARAILAKLGYDVTIYEALHLRAACWCTASRSSVCRRPSCRRKSITSRRSASRSRRIWSSAGILTIEELKDEYGFEAVFIGTGAGLPRFMNIPGENLKGVYSANEFLTRSNLMKAYRDDSTRRSSTRKRWRSSAAATLQWTRRAPRSVLARKKSTSSTAVRHRRTAGTAAKKSSTRWKRASSSML